MEHLKYWLKLDNLTRIRRYGPRSHLRYVLNPNVDRVVVNLQRELKDLPELRMPKGFEFRPAHLDEPVDQAHWVRLVNTAYPDGREDKDSAQRLKHGHAFLAHVETFFLCCSSKPVGTVSIGVFRSDPTYGGHARIAVDPSFQGQGLGSLLVRFALHHLHAKGLIHAEAVITLMRKTSIRLHFKLGFQIPPNRSMWKFDKQKRIWPVRRIVRSRLYRIRHQIQYTAPSNPHGSRTMVQRSNT